MGRSKDINQSKQATLLKKRIRRKLSEHLGELGFEKNEDGTLSPPSDQKQVVRNLHEKQRQELLNSEERFLHSNLEKLLPYFASGVDVIPQKISPRLELIDSHCWQSDLFRLAGLTWSIPVSRGYGRRMRFLVWDDFNGKLIGIFALGDPVFNSKVRDDYVGWTPKDRIKKLVNCMDAYVLGALPPYNFLLGGKMMACLIRSKEVQAAFREKYGDTKGIISGKRKDASLSLVTTSSALGKSSVYNRLKLGGVTYFEDIGYTEGWGHFHIPNSLFLDIREYLAAIKHPYATGHQFGHGPNWKMRATRAALESMDINGDLLRHGIFREVYACKFIENASAILTGKESTPKGTDLKSAADIGAEAVDRWLVPRAERYPQYLYWKNTEIKKLLSSTDYRPVSLGVPKKSGIKKDLLKAHAGLSIEEREIFVENVRRLSGFSEQILNIDGV